MPVHEVAAAGFGPSAASYERARPSSPPEVVGWLVEHLGISGGARICDLGAGTGKRTRALTGRPVSLGLIWNAWDDMCQHP